MKLHHIAIIALSILVSACGTPGYNSSTAWTAGNPNSLYNRTQIIDTKPSEDIIAAYDLIGYENLTPSQKRTYATAKQVLEDDGVVILEDRLEGQPQYVKDNCVALKLC